MGYSAVVFAINETGGRVVRELLGKGIDILLLVSRPRTDSNENLPHVIAEKEGIPFVIIESFTDELCLKISLLQPDFVISGWFHLRIPKIIIKSSKLVSVNFHPSLLPAYRGATPVEWCIMNGETYSGLTLHRLEEQFDTGEILWQDKKEILPDETSGALLKKISSLVSPAIDNLLTRADNNDFAGITQETGLSTYYPKRSVSDGEIHWSWDALKIHNRIRGLNPWPLAYFNSGKRIHKVHGSKVRTASAQDIKPGTLVDIDPDGRSVSVFCNDNNIIEMYGIDPPLNISEVKKLGAFT